MERIRILISCGSGIATSKHVAQKVSELLREAGIAAEIDTCSISEFADKQADYDVLLTTAKSEFSFNRQVINAVPFLTGIQVEQVKKELLDAVGKV